MNLIQLIFLILLVMVVIATASFAVHKILSNTLHHLLRGGKMERGIRGNIIGNYLKYQKLNPG